MHKYGTFPTTRKSLDLSRANCYMKRVLAAVLVLVTAAATSSALKAESPCPELHQASNKAMVQAPAGATIGGIESDRIFGCQHLDAARIGSLRINDALFGPERS